MAVQTKSIVIGLALVLVLILGARQTHFAQANAAPPETAAGAGLAPGTATTFVQMTAEEVNLTLSPDGLQALVEGTYWLRNQGNSPETMTVRFPLAYLTDEGNAWPPCPEITGLQVWVDDRPVRWERIESTPTGFCHRETAPWAGFEVTFPPAQDVKVRVRYTQQAWGQRLFWVLTYIVETGAGWYDTIGTGSVSVTFPYPATPEHILLNGHVGYGHTTPGAVLEGRTMRWTFQNLEPGPQDNFWVLYVDPRRWQDVLAARERVTKEPQNGDAWGFLGLALKRVLQVPNLWQMGLVIRDDAAASDLLTEALHAYQQAVYYADDDPDWHFGYAEMLLAAAAAVENADPVLAHQHRAEATRQLAAALTRDPNHKATRDFLASHGWMLEGWVSNTGNGYAFPGLTATPPLPTRPAPSPTPASRPTRPAPTATMAASPSQPPPLATFTPTPASVATSAPAQPNSTPWRCLPLMGLMLLSTMVIISMIRRYSLFS